MIKKSIGIFHILLSVFICFYIFIFTKNFNYDFIYIICSILQILSWIDHDDKCPITYYYIKYISNSNDHFDVFKLYLNANLITLKKYFNIYKLIFVTFNIISIYYASVRSNILTPILSLLLILIRILYILYNSADYFDTIEIGNLIFGKSFSKVEKMYDDSGFHSMTEPYFNNVILIIQILFLIYIFVHNKKRLHI